MKKMLLKTTLFLAAALLLAANGAALAQANADPTPDMSAMEADPLAPVTVGDIEITDAFARATLPNAPVAGGYLTITNKGTDDDRLVSATSPAAGKVELQYNRLHTFRDHEVPTQYYAFWDFGKVWSEEPSWVSAESLSSAGVGAHLQVFKDMYVSPELAFPLTRKVSAEELDDDNGKAPRFYLNFLKLF